MIVIMAGLPGTGKTTLCRHLAQHFSGSVLNKDEIRHALFSPGDIEYSTAQDDLCMEVMLRVAAYLLGKNPVRYVFLDGRAFSRRYQIERVLQVAGELHQPWRILECLCSDETARKRLESQAGEHPAGNRDYILYRDLKSRFEEILSPKSVIDTEHEMEKSIQQGLAALR